jgi:hypothetical protein
VTLKEKEAKKEIKAANPLCAPSDNPENSLSFVSLLNVSDKSFTEDVSAVSPLISTPEENEDFKRTPL